MENNSQFPQSACPHLGTYNDPEVHFRFPTISNYCYHANPPSAVNVSHQETHCLRSEFDNCPIYVQEWDKPLPSNLRANIEEPQRKADYPLMGWIVLLIILIVLFALVLYFLNPFESTKQSPAAILPDTPQLSSTLILSATFASATPQPTTSHTTLPTATPLPSLTPSTTLTSPPTQTGTATIPTPAPLLGTPFTTNHTYIIHQVREGESLPLLANRYETSQGVIRVLNAARLTYGTLPDVFLILMPGQTDSANLVELDLVYLDEYVRVSDFASQHAITEEELRQYNGLGPGDIISPERWLIFPDREILPTITLTPLVTADLSQALTESIGPNDEYVLHQVKANENIGTLEALYLTSNDVIQKANIIQGSIRIDQVLVILPNRTDPTGITPFRVTQLVEEKTVEELADELGVPASDLVYYNDLTPGQVLPPGRWIIYPAQP